MSDALYQSRSCENMDKDTPSAKNLNTIFNQKSWDTPRSFFKPALLPCEKMDKDIPSAKKLNTFFTKKLSTSTPKTTDIPSAKNFTHF